MEKKYECKSCGYDIGFDIVDNKIRCQCCHTVAGEMTNPARKNESAKVNGSYNWKYIPKLTFDLPIYEPIWDGRSSW